MIKEKIKKLIISAIIILLLSTVVSCGKNGDDELERETEVDSLFLNDFKASLNDREAFIPIEIHDGMIYFEDRLIYMDDTYAAADGFSIVTMFSETFLLNKNKKDLDNNYSINPFMFSSDIQRVIMTVDGSKWDDKDNIDKSYFDAINEAGLYSISGIDEDIIRVLNRELLYKYCEDRYDGTWINAGGVTDIDKKELMDINKKVKSKIKKEKFSNSIYKLFAVKNKDAFPKYVNYFNKDGYTIIDGFIVQNEAAIEHMNALSSFDRSDYQAIEKEVFKLNNDNATIYDDKTYTMNTYKKGEFLSDGKPAWVTRVNGEAAIDIYGNKVYAYCSKTFDEFKIYCGGTNVAFRGWVDEVVDDPDELYNSLLIGRGTWDDEAFVDEQVKYIPVRNDDPKYYEEYIAKIKAKERENLDKYVSERLEQIESK